MTVINMANAQAAITHGQEQAAGKYLSSLIEARKAPGLQYVLVDADHVLFKFNGGYADIGEQRPVGDSTTFNGYSITKTFTAAAILKLAAESRIDLDAPISRYVQDIPYQGVPTVRQTLQHTAGFPNPNPMPWIHRADKHGEFDAHAFISKVIREHPKLDFEPGEKFAYSNIGYLLLGEAIHRVSGKPYEQYVLSEIIEPLSLAGDQHISFTIDHPENHARGHIRRWNWLNLFLGWFFDREKFLVSGSVEGWVEFRDLLPDGAAYGGLVGSASGFARYLQAILKVEPPFTREMLDKLWTPGTTLSGERLPVGLAWFERKMGSHRYLAHSGGAGGYYCEMRIYPDAKLASVIMTNNTGITRQNLLDGIDRIFLDQGN